jgi:AcrR family transcriptional regulator
MRADAQANRDRILSAAEQVIADAGADGSTEAVARRAGVGIGTVFRHFPTKQELIEATIVRHFEQLTAHARELAACDDAEAALRELIETMVGGTATKIMLLGLLGDATTDAVVRASRELRSAVRALLRRAQQAGGVRSDVSVDHLYLLVRGLALAVAQRPTKATTRRKALDVVLAGLAPQSPRHPGLGTWR